MPPFGKQLPARSLTTQTYESPSITERLPGTGKRGGGCGDHHTTASELPKRLRGVSVQSATQSMPHSTSA